MKFPIVIAVRSILCLMIYVGTMEKVIIIVIIAKKVEEEELNAKHSNK